MRRRCAHGMLDSNQLSVQRSWQMTTAAETQEHGSNQPIIGGTTRISGADAPQPPIAHLSGRRLIDLSDGRATLAIPASPYFRGPKGRIDSGMLAFLADMTHFYAVVSTLPAGAACTTAELSITFLGQPPDAGGELTASSEVVYADERNALALAFVRDDQGRPVAYSTSRYFVFSAGTYTPRRGAEASPTGVRSTLPDPHSGTREWAFLPLEEHTLERLSGLEILKAELAGDRV